jgi:hypothetical protein
VRRLRRNVSLAVLAVLGSAGMAGCASQQPWELPDPYGYDSGRGGSVYAPYGSSPYGYGYGYGPQYGYGYSDPYYYYGRQGVPLPYPAYGYDRYPSYPGYYCRDYDRDGRCDRRVDRDHDRDDDARNHRNRPLRDVRRLIRDREEARSNAAGTAPAVSQPSPAPRNRAGGSPTLRTVPRAPAPAGAPPRVEPRRGYEAAAPARRAPREEPTAKGPRDDSRPARPPR